MDDRTLDDDRLLGLLGEVLDEIDPVPDDAVAAARAANLLRLEGELAELVFDSLLDDRSVGLRDEPAGAVRSLTFTAGDRTIEVDLTEDDLVGRVTPAEAASLVLVQPAGRRPIATDELGRFRTPVAPGPLRLQVAGGSGPAATPWITR